MRSPQLTDANILPLDKNTPDRIETATFGLGCFWSPDAQFGSIPGVVRTRVGYAGGCKDDPTYHDLGDHTETVEIDYDPQVLSYTDLLDLFWSAHKPLRPSFKRQYMSLILYRSDEQKQQAEDTKAREVQKYGEIHTEISPLSRFYLAEDYHQKYRLRHRPEFMKAFEDIYNDEQFVNSTVAARVNGYLSGYGKLEQLQAEIDEFGLPDRLCRKLEQHATRSR